MNGGTAREQATARHMDERAAAREQRLERMEQARKTGPRLQGVPPTEVVTKPTDPVAGGHQPYDLVVAQGGYSALGALSSHEKVRQAFLFIELLSSPVSMRDQEQDQR